MKERNNIMPTRPKSKSGMFKLENGNLCLTYNNIDYIKTQDILFAPVFKEKPLAAPVKVKSTQSQVTYNFENGPVKRHDVFIEDKKTHFEIYSESLLSESVTLSEWGIFGGCSTIPGFDQIVVANPNIKGRLTTGVFDKMRIADQYSEFSHTMGIGVPSWFFPLPVNYICASYHEIMFLGLDNVYDFAQWTISVKNKKISKWALEYGGHIQHQKGAVIRAPKWIGFFIDSDDPFEPWPVYTEILKRKKVFKNDHAKRPEWWSGMNYVTWGDQHVYNDGTSTKTYLETETNLSGETLERWTGIIDKYDLPFKIITIDGFWSREIGDWHPDEKRFPDMRKLVDSLHRRGFKVLFWYCPYEAEYSAPIFKEHPEFFLENIAKQALFLEDDLQLETRPQYDYTNPAVRRFIEQDIRRIISPEKGCLNGDGLKLDFYASAPDPKKIKNFYNPAWGLGHSYILKSHSLIYKWAKKYKPDCRVDGENGNPFFSDFTDNMRAWDWCESDYKPYNDRVKLASVICPGVPALYDEHIHLKNLFKYCVRSAVARPIFFNVDYFHGDMRKPSDHEYRNLSVITNVIQELNISARDVRPENIDDGTIFDKSGKLIGRAAPDDTALTTYIKGKFNVVFVNDTENEKFMSAGVDPGEFGVRGKPFTVSREVPPNTVQKIIKTVKKV